MKDRWVLIVWRWSVDQTIQEAYIERVEGLFNLRKLATARQREVNKHPQRHSNVFKLRSR